MGVVSVTGPKCPRCGIDRWYVREPGSDVSLFRGKWWLSIALLPLRALDSVLAWLVDSGQVRSVRATPVHRTAVAAGEMVWRTSGYRTDPGGPT